MKKLQKFAYTMQNKGQVLVLVAVSLVILLALAALATDVGIAYSIKAKLNAAVDGAAIAAGSAIKQGANAEEAAGKFFNANYPTGYMGSTIASGPTTITSQDTDPTSPDYLSWKVNVVASAHPPRFFARALSLLQGGWGQMTVRAEAETTVRTLDLILVLDTSGSMSNTDPGLSPPASAISALGPAAWNFINRFQETSEGDRIGVVTFASGAVVNVPIYKSARGFNKTAIRNLLCTSPTGACVNRLPASGSTASGEAMRRALTELNSINSSVRSSLRVIVFFSDGAPNDAAGTFTTGSGSSVVGCLYSEADSGTNPLVSGYYRVSETTRADRVYYIDLRDQYRGSYTIPTLPTSMNYSTILGLPTVPETRIVNVGSDTGSRTMPNFSNTECNVNRAARNMVENVANTARSGTGTNAVTIHSLGLGQRLKTLEASQCSGYGTNEWGESILKRLANTEDASPRQASQPTGLYAYASTAAELDEAFDAIAAKILRFTK